MKQDCYDVIIVGGGAAGIITAIVSAQKQKRVLLLEKLPQIASKLKATGGGKCNLTNTLSNENFISHFGKNGRFMRDTLEAFDHKDLIDFFSKIGVETHAPDGFRVFPTSHSSDTIIKALKDEIKKVGVEVKCGQKVEHILTLNKEVSGVKTSSDIFHAKNIVLATGGLGYPMLGSEGDGYKIAKELGHTITQLYPAMMPLYTKERWMANCKADTISKVTVKVNLKKHKKLHAIGDLIFTKNGIRGPVVLDFAREITPLLEKYGEVPLLLNFTKGMNEDQITNHLKKESQKNPHANISKHLKNLIPHSVAIELCKLSDINPLLTFKELEGIKKAKLIKLLAWTPLTIIGHDGFKKAMITRGGVTLKEIYPKTMQSRLIKGLYFCGEVINLDGPCGGYNLQWSFSSGFTVAMNLT